MARQSDICLVYRGHKMKPLHACFTKPGARCSKAGQCYPPNSDFFKLPITTHSYI